MSIIAGCVQNASAVSPIFNPVRFYMFHTCAWVRSSDATANLDQTPVPDGILVIQNAHFQPQQDMYVLWAKHNGVTQTRARFNSATLRQVSPVFIRPIDAALLPATLTRPANWVRNPLRIRGLEEIIVESTNSAAGPNNVTTSAGLSTSPIVTIPSGDVWSMRGTATTTAGVDTWTLCAMTWADTIPAGDYIAVGLNAAGATMKAARLIFENQYWRPGCVAGASEAVIQDEIFRNGGLGTWGAFTGNRMPNVEVLCNAADTAQTIYLDFIKVR